MTIPPENRSSEAAAPEREEHEFQGPTDDHGFEDGRKRWEWQTRYPAAAQGQIKMEAWLVGAYLILFLVPTSVCAGLAGQVFDVAMGDSGRVFHIEVALISTFFMGGLGGTTFSIKWLMHSVATGKWHEDRLYWRIFVPVVGGVYAVIVLNLLSAGLIGGGAGDGTQVRPSGTAAALAFLVGYFSDGVSGLLTNVANAVFGTVQKK